MLIELSTFKGPSNRPDARRVLAEHIEHEHNRTIIARRAKNQSTALARKSRRRLVAGTERGNNSTATTAFPAHPIVMSPQLFRGPVFKEIGPENPL